MTDSARQRRVQQVEAKYAADLRNLRQAKEDDLQELDERYKVLKKSNRLERINIKEEYAMKRLDIKTKVERLRDQRANVRHARSCDLPLDGLPDLDELTSQIHALLVQHIGLERQEHAALADVENRFDARCKENQEERRAINKHYINEAERLHEQYLALVEQNRQDRDAEEGGES